jgi:CheY-like chemotaxis protein
VLVVDDDPEIRETLSLILRDEGYDLSQAADGAEAIERMQATTEPMLVLLDMWMPIMNGEMTLLATLAQDALWSRICFIVMTANPQLMSPRVREILDLYTIPLLVKPFDLDPFVEVVLKRVQQFTGVPAGQRARRSSGALG